MDFHTEDCVSQKWSIYHLLSSSYIKIFHLLSFKLNTGPEVFRHGHGMSLVSAKVHYSLSFRELHQWTRLLCACAQSRIFTIDGIKSVKRYKSKCRHTWGFWSKVQLEDYYDPRWGPCFKQHLGEIELCNNVACNSNIMSSCYLCRRKDLFSDLKNLIATQNTCYWPCWSSVLFLCKIRHFWASFDSFWHVLM